MRWYGIHVECAAVSGLRPPVLDLKFDFYLLSNAYVKVCY